jgi:hypothetical protein
MKYLLRFAAAIVLILPGYCLHATTLTGTSVTGYLGTGAPPNFYDPANNNPPASFVPPTYLNATSPTVTIDDFAVEFGAAGGGLPSTTILITSDFTATQLVVDLQEFLQANSTSFAGTTIFQFQDAAFVGMQVAKLSDTFTNGGLTPSLVGDTLTLTWAGEFFSASTDPRNFDRAATYEFSSSTPEPGSALLLLSGTVALAFATRRTRQIRTKQVN